MTLEVYTEKVKKMLYEDLSAYGNKAVDEYVGKKIDFIKEAYEDKDTASNVAYALSMMYPD